MSTKIDPQLVESFRQIVQTSAFSLVVPHINPDGDAIGACLALRGILKNMNQKVRVIIPNEFPEFLQWMDGVDDVVDFEKTQEK